METTIMEYIGFRVAHGLHLNVLASTNPGQMDGGIQEHTSHIVFHPAQPKVSPW